MADLSDKALDDLEAKLREEICVPYAAEALGAIAALREENRKLEAFGADAIALFRGRHRSEHSDSLIKEMFDYRPKWRYRKVPE